MHRDVLAVSPHHRLCINDPYDLRETGIVAFSFLRPATCLGVNPGGTKARILARLEAAESKGLSTRKISKKLCLSLARVGVWVSSTGKVLTTKLALSH